ncbi:redoxin domain-containing protein [Aquabacterium sp.]|uniref:redoxin domain-containing protein n=2 Tax=Aquabacterium sp. TaxID=1872578 RepID=UPI003B6BA3D2
MKTVGDKLETFKVVGVKPGFLQDVEHGHSAFEDITEKSFPGKWKVIYFYPKDFTAVCGSEVAGFDRLSKAFADRNAVLMGGSTDNEHSKLGWRRESPELSHLAHFSFADETGSLLDQLGVRDKEKGIAMRATFVVDPDNVIRHVTVNGIFVGRNPEETLRVLDALQTEAPCVCNREVGGETL